MRVTAVKDFAYGDRKRRVGDTFEMSDTDARLMIGFGKVQCAAMKSQTPAAAAAAPAEDDQQRQRRTYRRRDMVADGKLDV